MEATTILTRGGYDNALAETINGLYKAEIIHRRGPWKTREAVELATLEWVSWFNHHRLLQPVGYIPPTQAEANYWSQQAQASITKSLPSRQCCRRVEPWVHGPTGGPRRPLRGAGRMKVRPAKAVRSCRSDSSQQASSKAGAVQSPVPQAARQAHADST